MVWKKGDCPATVLFVRIEYTAAAGSPSTRPPPQSVTGALLRALPLAEVICNAAWHWLDTLLGPQDREAGNQFLGIIPLRRPREKG